MRRKRKMKQEMTDYSDDDAMSMASGVSAFESREFSKAIRLLNPFAEQGDSEAQYRVATMMLYGLGMVKNEPQGVKMMKAAAEKGHALAQHGLGFMYFEGECIEQNGEKAIEWFRKAAEQGMLGSATTMAMMYEQGDIVPQDFEKAKHWYSLAGFDDKAEELG
jgi:TPR repeat protein